MNSRIPAQNRTRADISREARLRNTAKRQGLTLRRSRRRDPLALDFDKYFLTRRVGDEEIEVGSRHGLTLGAVETFLLNPNT